MVRMFFKCALQGELFIDTHVRRCFDVTVQGIIDIDVRLYTLLFPEKENRGREKGERQGEAHCTNAIQIYTRYLSNNHRRSTWRYVSRF